MLVLIWCIDQVNKPDLPLASGEFTPSTGLAIVVGCAVASLMIGQVAGTPPLMATLLVSLGLGIVYSVELPFLRWVGNILFLFAALLKVSTSEVVQRSFRGLGRGLPCQGTHQIKHAAIMPSCLWAPTSTLITTGQLVISSPAAGGRGLPCLPPAASWWSELWQCSWGSMRTQRRR
jgi:hypothetical protein